MAGESLSGQLGRTLPGLVPGSLVGGYRVQARIGAGGMAVVFRAQDEALGRTVALKVLAPTLAGDGEFRERFIRESRAVAAVDHPHIVPVYAAGEADGVLYLAMRFISGGDLSSVVQREGPLPGDRAVFLLLPIAAALDAAHAAGLVHRDVKPANILIDASPGRAEHPYLSDFGLAKDTTSSTGLTGIGQFLGTPDYAAPEQISGKPARPQTDQYALACVAFTVLTGKLPFARNESMAVLWAHMYDSPPSVTAQRPDLPAAVDSVIARALAKSLEDRYVTCEEFISALRTALGSRPRSLPSVGTQPGWAPRQPGHGFSTQSASRPIPQRSVLPFPLSAPPAAVPASSPPVSYGETGTFRSPPGRSRLTGEPDGRPALGYDLDLPMSPAPPGRGATATAARNSVAAKTDAVSSPPRTNGKAPRRFSRRTVIMSAAVALVLLIGVGLYGFWSSGQSEYHVGEQSGYVAIFHGSNLVSRSTLPLGEIGTSSRNKIAQTIPEGSVGAAQGLISQLQTQASRCQAEWQALATWQAANVSYQDALTRKNPKTKVPANPGAQPATPRAADCGSASAFGIPSSALPAKSAVSTPTSATASASPSETVTTTRTAAPAMQAQPTAATSPAVAPGPPSIFSAYVPANDPTEVVLQIRYGTGFSKSSLTIEVGVNSPTKTDTWSVQPGNTTGSLIFLNNLPIGKPVTLYAAECNDNSLCSSWTGPTDQLTPYDPIGTPTVTAVANGTEINYTWSAPSDGLTETLQVCVAGACTNYPVPASGGYSGSSSATYGYGQQETITAKLTDTAGQGSSTVTASATTDAAP